VKGLNLSKFSKVHDDGQLVTMRHYQGHEIRIAKNKLSKQMREDLEKLPVRKEKAKEAEPVKMADGGVVAVPGAQDMDHRAAEAQAVAMTQANPGMTLGDAYTKIYTQPAPESPKFRVKGGDFPADPASAAPQLTQPAAAPTEAPPAPSLVDPASVKLPDSASSMVAPTATPMQQAVAAQDDSLDLTRKGMMEEASGIRGVADAEMRTAKQQAKLLEAAQLESQGIANQAKNNFSAYKAQADAVMQDLRDGKIDPNHFMSNMGTGTKIASALGVLLSGIGAGLTHTDNMAMKYIQGQIDRDIDAQKANLAHKGTLLNVLHQQYGDQNDALAMARVHMNDALKLQLEKAAASNPTAAAKAQQMIGQLDVQNASVLGQAAARRTEAQIVANLNNNPDAAQQTFQALDMLHPEKSKELRERYVPGMGIANTPDQQKELNKSLADTVTTKKGIHRLLEISDTPGKSLSPQLRAEASTISKLLMGSMKDSIGFKTLTDGDQKFLEQVIADPTHFTSLDSGIKSRLNATLKYADTALADKAAQAGLKYDPVKMLPAAQRELATKVLALPDSDIRKGIALKKLGL
jgi:hypothetical protein